jgi:hypothetical protein
MELSLELYRGPAEPPTLSRSDVLRIPGDEAWLHALSEIVLREAPWLGSGTGGPDDDWTREITPLIVNYWDSATADDYLRTRADELAVSPQFGFASRSSATVAVAPLTSNEVAGEDRRDVFISHASDDKDAIARPLAEELVARGRTVWFDELELVLGESLRQRIEGGLAHCTIGVVILSHAFFRKRWPKKELDALHARLMGGESNVIVPVWHELDEEDLVSYAPGMADLLAGTSEQGIGELADAVEKALERRLRRNGGTSEGSTAHRGGSKASPEQVDESSDGQEIDLYGEVLGLLRDKDDIGLDEILRREEYGFASEMEAVSTDYRQRHLDEATVADSSARLVAAADRRLESLLPLGVYDPPRVEAELLRHADWASRVEPQGGSATWQECWRLPFWAIGMTLGAVALRRSVLPTVRAVLAGQWTNAYQLREAFLVDYVGEAGEAVAGRLLGEAPAGRTWAFAPWTWLGVHLAESKWMARVDPVLSRADRIESAMAELDMLGCITAGLSKERDSVALWSIDSPAAEAFARRLRDDDRLRAQIADVVGTTLSTFDENAPTILAECRGVGMFPRVREVAAALRTGSIH